MVVHVFTKELQEKKKLEKLTTELLQENTEDDLKEIVIPKNVNKQILENIWHKLYLLQNYNITKDMFLGSNLRWSSIETYLGYIRSVYKNKVYKNPLPKSLVNYIQGLMDSGTEPYSLPFGQKVRQVTIQELIDSNILTKQQIDYIYSPVGITDSEVDTSSAWTQCSHERNVENHEHNFYTDIVEFSTNPIKRSFGLKPLFKI